MRFKEKLIWKWKKFAALVSSKKDEAKKVYSEW